MVKPHSAWYRGMLIALLVCSSGTALAEEAPSLERYEATERQMGVPFTIVLYAPSEEAANVAVKAAFARIKELNWIFSDYEPESELMRLCRASGPDQPVQVSDDLYRILEQADALSRRTNGAFDVSVGPVVRLWRMARRRRLLPPDEVLEDARKLVGYQHIRLDKKSRTVELKQAGMRLDLGGIAKGYAADAALATLREHGITRAFIDGSGDVRFGEAPPGKKGWRVGIAPLTAADAPPSRYVLLENAAVATSGDAWQFVEIDGKRYSHIVDPRTGLGLTDRSSVTIIAPNGTLADSLATAVSVLGPEAGLRLIDETPDTAAFIVRAPEGEPVTHISSRFETFVDE